MQDKNDCEDVIQEISTDLFKIEMFPVELQPGSVNIYLIRGKERSLIIDAGLQDEKCMNIMRTAINRLGLDLERTDFFITHCHADHVGLASGLIHPKSSIYLNKMEGSGVLLPEFEELSQICGFPEKHFEQIVPFLTKDNLSSKEMPPFHFLSDGDKLNRGGYCFTCIETPGHSKGHICLYEPIKKMLFSGDHLLKDIAPAVPWRTGGANPLREYLSSLEKVVRMDIETILPGHGQLFTNPRQRIKEIQFYHWRQNRKILSVLQDGDKSVYETSHQMMRRRNSTSGMVLYLLQSFFLALDTLTHLDYLEEEGRITKAVKGQISFYSLV